MLERQRLRKSPEELAMLRTASEKVIDSMMAAIAQHGPGSTKAEIAETLRLEEVNRGLTFEYCLIAAGTSHNPQLTTAANWGNFGGAAPVATPGAPAAASTAAPQPASRSSPASTAA